MSRDDPAIGQVIAHDYLWKHEADKGQEEATKIGRACAITRVQPLEEGERRVFVVPISHLPPEKNQTGLELPIDTKKRLGLDDERSWLITSELNYFLWPGYDVRDTRDGRERFGTLSGNTIRAMREQVAEQARSQRLNMVDRDDEASRARAVKPQPPKPPQPVQMKPAQPPQQSRPKPPLTKPRDPSKPRDRDDDITR